MLSSVWTVDNKAPPSRCEAQLRTGRRPPFIVKPLQKTCAITACVVYC